MEPLIQAYLALLIYVSPIPYLLHARLSSLSAILIESTSYKTPKICAAGHIRGGCNTAADLFCPFLAVCCGSPGALCHFSLLSRCSAEGCTLAGCPDSTGEEGGGAAICTCLSCYIYIEQPACCHVCFGWMGSRYIQCSIPLVMDTLMISRQRMQQLAETANPKLH